MTLGMDFEVTLAYKDTIEAGDWKTFDVPDNFNVSLIAPDDGVLWLDSQTINIP